MKIQIRSIDELPKTKNREMYRALHPKTIINDRYYKKSFNHAINFLNIRNRVNEKCKQFEKGRKRMRARQQCVLDALIKRAKSKKNIQNKNEFRNISLNVIREYERKRGNIPRNLGKIQELLKLINEKNIPKSSQY